ncbi:MAG TPA: hydrolase 2, exosortase A system-associated [Steroidobacteraceae bacterium]|nr:hydrolase 2, exosortase A system-associated [Steroidobacteraceae bacterium]
MSDSTVTARFIERGSHRIFVLAHRPAARSGRAVLIAPPFAEEMNKTRRMLSEAGRELAARGVATVLPDLRGTGDSSGEFGDADWESWRGDLRAAAEWSAAEGWPVAALLGVRAGCILGAQFARELPRALTRTVFWQPVIDGERYLRQFLRLRVAASMMGGVGESAGGLRARLAGGEPLEVSGYLLSPRMAEQLAALRLTDVTGIGLGYVHWMEVGRAPGSALAPESQRAVDAMRAGGLAVAICTAQSEPFWSSTEIVTVPELISATVNALGAAP